MFIDIHAHAYRKPVELPLPFLVKFSTAEEVLKRYDEMGIDMGCLLPIVNPEIYMPQANEDILDMAEKYPDRFIPFCNIDPRALTNSADAPLDYLLRYYKDKGCKGLGEVMLNVPVMHPMVQNLFLINPVYLFIRYFRKIVIDMAIPSVWFHLLMGGYTVVVLAIGCWMYKKYNHRFLYYV